VLQAPGDSWQLLLSQSLLIRVSSACECVDFSGASSLGWLLCSPLDCSAASPKWLNQLRRLNRFFFSSRFAASSVSCPAWSVCRFSFPLTLGGSQARRPMRALCFLPQASALLRIWPMHPDLLTANFLLVLALVGFVCVPVSSVID
jgi:hypothetical protein